MRHEFTLATKRALAERAGYRCARPECGRSTVGPSDAVAEKSSRTGKACHITAASSLGPRYDDSLSPQDRSAPSNGIWLCAICADRVDKPENVAAFPPELLRSWKEQSESTPGTDHATPSDKSERPVLELSIVDFGGVQGRACVRFGALTVCAGTSKLSCGLSDMLRVFSDRDAFLVCRQPITDEGCRDPESGQSGHGIQLVVHASDRTFAPRGELILRRSDGSSIAVVCNRGRAEMWVDDVRTPVFSPSIDLVEIPRLQAESFERGAIDGLMRCFALSGEELVACLEGVPGDGSLFGFCYELGGGDLKVRVGPRSPFLPLQSLSGGELDRVALDLGIRVAYHNSRLHPTVLGIREPCVPSLDGLGWGRLFEWIEGVQPPFQVVVDLWSRPRSGKLTHALCYDVVGGDMSVEAFNIVACSEFTRS